MRSPVPSASRASLVARKRQGGAPHPQRALQDQADADRPEPHVQPPETDRLPAGTTTQQERAGMQEATAIRQPCQDQTSAGWRCICDAHTELFHRNQKILLTAGVRTEKESVSNSLCAIMLAFPHPTNTSHYTMPKAGSLKNLLLKKSFRSSNGGTRQAVDSRMQRQE